MIRLAASILVLAAAPALASAPPSASAPDTSAVSSQAASALQQAQAAYSAAQQAKALIPPVCSSTPARDTLLGAVGTAAACMPLADNSRPTAVQAINTPLAADCTWSVTFARATVSASPIVHATLKLAAGATQPVPCQPIAISATGASGKCFPAQATTLNLSIVTAGLSVSPFGSTCTAGMTVMVNVREPTQ